MAAKRPTVAQVKELEKAIKDLTDSNNSWKYEVQNLKVRIAELSSIIEHKEKVIQNSNDALESKNTAICKMRQDLNKLYEERDNLNSAYTNMKNVADKACERAGIMRTQRNELVLWIIILALCCIVETVLMIVL